MRAFCVRYKRHAAGVLSWFSRNGIRDRQVRQLYTHDRHTGKRQSSDTVLAWRDTAAAGWQGGLEKVLLKELEKNGLGIPTLAGVLNFMCRLFFW